jgi:AraC family transcriptional regulator
VIPAAYGDVRWNPPWQDLGRHNAVLSESGPKQVTSFAGALSVKHMLSGVAVWTAGGRRFRVEGSTFLVLNHGTVYTLERGAAEPTESFCPFFARGFVEDAGRALRASAERLLDTPDATPTGVGWLGEQLYRGDERVVPRLRALARTIHGGAATALGVESAFFDLARALVLSQRGVEAEIARIPALRASTRHELHARLQRGRERMHDGLGERLGLVEIARTAGVAPHHFHRAFRAVYGETPHRYLTRLRLERAARLLVETDRGVTEICAAVGFESPGSFSVLFRRAFGRPPSEIRKIRAAGRAADPVGSGA